MRVWLETSKVQNVGSNVDTLGKAALGYQVGNDFIPLASCMRAHRARGLLYYQHPECVWGYLTKKNLGSNSYRE
jgi:hypothetical protein